MTRRATVTQAELARAIRAADAAGKVVLVTQAGIAFVDPGIIAQTGPTESGDTCAGKFGRQP
jgi:hypothetical protein